LPASITQDDNRVRLRRGIFLRQKSATQKRGNAENIKIVAGGERAPDALVVPIVAEASDGDAIRKETGQDLIAVAVILVVEIRLQRVIGAVVQSAVKLIKL
jgi:hypothetical protein